MISYFAGSGKTAAFALPVLERLLLRSRRLPAIYVLVLTPTRELAVQVSRSLYRAFFPSECVTVHKKEGGGGHLDIEASKEGSQAGGWGVRRCTR